ncbi:glycosyltransferase [Salibacterium halotolerans]|uniref:Glycosyltransferase involved in cell wall bisynthesis n=1 Tax=Salibacterium halotolerans TaxID=1884432 RepID=A0A1I5XWM9_9BACI|nr:glycosyltransferase [Salibacterium halotolerans]SFQ36127.1 Glycosyltransferase involved in cell wall bisynthesis [Salibacterium halotolerans]
MNVFIIPSWYPTSTNSIKGVFFKEQAQALQKNGVDVTVLYPDLWSIKRLGKVEEEKGIIFSEEESLNTYRYNGYNFFPRMPYMAGLIFYKRLKKLYGLAVKQYGKPDIIHAHSCIWGGVAASKLSRKENIPLVITEHSTAFSRGIIKPYQEKLIRNAVNKTNKLIAVGPGLKENLEQYAPEKDISIIPNIVDTDKFTPKDPSNNNKFRFFSMGMLTHKKGMDILIKAFANAFKGDSKVELVIGGDGEESENLKVLAQDLGAQDQVHFLGHLNREEAVHQMQKCNVFALASRHETFGVVFIEALACGKPIIATKSGGPDMIVNKNNGVLTEVNSVSALQSEMSQIKTSINFYDPIKIREDCWHRFSENAIVYQLFNIYKAYNKKKE